jgi:predicted ATP-dependent endonuclease of OLD family
MKLQKLEITNFRSIKKTEISLLDTDVATIIGANGSGKSNILKALVALKGDSTTPSETDFHAKDLSGNDEPILIAGTFAIETRDAGLLESNGLKDIKIKGIKVTVEKFSGKVPTIVHEAEGYIDNRGENVQRIQKDIVRMIKAITVDESLQEPKRLCIEKIEQEIDLEAENVDTQIADLTSLFDPIKAVNAEATEKIVKAFSNMKAWLNFDINSRLSKVFAQLNIELLQLNSYVIENNASIAELQNRTAHPFLFDLLLLANKKASEFTLNNTPVLSRIKKQASGHLSNSISNIWLSHDLKFEIDKQGDNLEFMVYTPQGHQVSLTDLSDGEQWFLKFYVRLAIAQKEKKQIIWLFDEPGRDLHTSSQIDLKGFFEEISKDSQVIYTSHLAMMIPWHRLERIFAVENSSKDATIIHKRFWNDSKLDSPLKEALSTFVGEELLGGKEHLIVEGVSDYFFLQGWMGYFLSQPTPKPWTAKYTLYKRIFVPVDGIDKIPLYCWFLGRKVKNKINWVVLVDSANESKSTAKKMTETGLGSWTKNIKSVGDVAGIKSPAVVDEIEGLFKPEEYFRLFQDYYIETYPDCKLPTVEEMTLKLVAGAKITKVLGVLLTEKNPSLTTEDGMPIMLDKTGIAQFTYKSLNKGGASRFSKETENKFLKLFENIEKTFDNEIEVEV